ncbi:hypothetical protein BGY98DRAFT_1030872, partial [Russula aff. rugulosa BPL654]
MDSVRQCYCTMPWQPTATPAAPSHLTSHSARRLCPDARGGCTCERLSIALQN